MNFNKSLVREKMQEWDGVLREYALPEWQDFPALPLYMDQVTYLMNRYLSLDTEGKGEERLVTPAMINNYVKLKIIPAPVKKRYGRVHLAFLVMVCMLKQSMNTSEIRKLLPLSMSEGEIRETYTAFTQVFREIKAYFAQEVRKASLPVLEENSAPVTHLVFRVAVSANLSHLLTEQLISLLPPNADGAPQTK